VLLSTAGCYDCPGPEPDPGPPVASVEIVPSELSAFTGATFQVRAQVRDNRGYVLPESRAANVSWTASGNLSVPTTSGAAISVTANPGSSPLPLTTELTASIEGYSATSSITIVDAHPQDLSMDWIVSDFGDKDPPTSVLATGIATREASPELRIDAPSAFVRRGSLDTFDCSGPTICGEVVVFSPGHNLVRAPVQWADHCDMVSFVIGVPVPTGCNAANPGPPSLGPPVHVPLVIWNASSAISDLQIATHVEYARKILEQRLSGLLLDVSPPKPTWNAEVVRGSHCQTTDEYDLITQLPGIPRSEFQRKRVTVVYVDEIWVLDESVPEGKTATHEFGYTCPYNPDEGAIIVLNGSNWLNSNLAHELGHALGQWPIPAPTHPDGLDGFDPSNLMWSEESDYHPAPRTAVTLGQLFQMSLAQSAFLRRSEILSPVEWPCQADPSTDARCPRLSKDLRR
jgi:hypothetical protein